MKCLLFILFLVVLRPSSIIASEVTLFNQSVLGSNISSPVVLFKSYFKNNAQPSGLQLKTDHSTFYYCSVGYNLNEPFIEFADKLSKEYGEYRIESQEKNKRIVSIANWLHKKQSLKIEAISVGNEPYVLVVYTILSPIENFGNEETSSSINTSNIVLFDPSIFGNKISSTVHVLPSFAKSSITPSDVRLGADGEIFTSATVFYAGAITFKQLEDLLERRYGSPGWRAAEVATKWIIEKENLGVHLMKTPDGAAIEYTHIK